MVRPIVKDIFFLRLKSEPAGKEDRQTGQDMLDTLKANEDRCVGMAANMIGVKKRIIVFTDNNTNVLMYNPVITGKEGPYETEEGCLSLSGERPTIRYEKITVEFEDAFFHKMKKTYRGWTAQIIQHECDHLEGIII